MATLVFVLVICLLLVLARGIKKHTPPKRTVKQKQADEIITVILPIIKNDG